VNWTSSALPYRKMGFGSRLPAGRPDQPPLSMRAGDFLYLF
jgi:hypothetical protein